MAKPTKNAPTITFVVGLIAVIGIILGFVFDSPLIAIVLLLPTIFYEVYRVEGQSTRFAAFGIAAVAIAEVLLIAFDVNLDLATLLDTNSKFIQGYEVPLADIKVVGPIILGILSIILFKNTMGRYTKALAVIIFLSSFAIVFILNPEIFNQLIKLATDEGLESLNTL